MSKRFVQVIGAMLLVATVGIVSCQALFADGRAVDTPSSATAPRGR